MFLSFRNISKKGSKNYKLLSDLELIEEYKLSNDVDCIGELFTRYTYLVFGICLKYLKNENDSEDAVMQIFEELIEKLDIHKIENFKSWLYSVTKNHCLMYLRKLKTDHKVKEKYYEKNKENIVEFIPEVHLNNISEKNDRSNITCRFS